MVSEVGAEKPPACKGAGGGRKVLTWALPRGSCRMPTASQAGSRTRSIMLGLDEMRCHQCGSATLLCSLGFILGACLGVCWFFPWPRPSRMKVSLWHWHQPLPSLPSPHIRGFGAFHVTGLADAGARQWLSRHLLLCRWCRAHLTASHGSRSACMQGCRRRLILSIC